MYKRGNQDNNYFKIVKRAKVKFHIFKYINAPFTSKGGVAVHLRKT